MIAEQNVGGNCSTISKIRKETRMIKTATNERQYPKLGPFYYYNDTIIAPDSYQRKLNPVIQIMETFDLTIFPREHRDMWDGYMLVKYPELKKLYSDDHKALPRGRVDFTTKNNKLRFFITLDKCIVEQESEIKKIYNLTAYEVAFHYGVINYKCIHCG